MTTKVYQCETCGGRDVEIRYWVKINTMELVEPWEHPITEGYCTSCVDVVSLVVIRQPEETVNTP